MKLKQAKHIHFSGIKGVGMTALALYTQDMGIKISGTDVEEEFVTDEILKKRKIVINTGFKVKNLPKEAEAVIYSGAHLKNPQVNYAKQKRILVASYAQALSELTANKEMIAVCGVGGKTTTTAMIATILEKAGFSPSFIDGVGNIPNLGVPGKFTQGKYVVVEADDYIAVPGVDIKPKFLYLHPKIIVVTNIAFDHPDVYRNLNETKTAFYAFFSRLPTNGCLIAYIDNPNVADLVKKLSLQNQNINLVTYGFSSQADWVISKTYIQKQRLKCLIDVKGIELDLSLKIPGKFNAANACAAMAACTQLGVSQGLAAEALSDFQGIKRRFEKVGNLDKIEVWDDYAHHPSEIQATLRAAKQWFPNKRLLVIFQPHTYSRTKALLPEFARSLAIADQVIITEIYSSARETKDDSISGELLAEHTQQFNKNVKFINSNFLLKYLRKSTSTKDVIITLGAGDIYKHARKLVKNK